jgi:hypothetical protein
MLPANFLHPVGSVAHLQGVAHFFPSISELPAIRPSNHLAIKQRGGATFLVNFHF